MMLTLPRRIATLPYHATRFYCSRVQVPVLERSNLRLGDREVREILTRHLTLVKTKTYTRSFTDVFETYTNVLEKAKLNPELVITKQNERHFATCALLTLVPMSIAAVATIVSIFAVLLTNEPLFFLTTGLLSGITWIVIVRQGDKYDAQSEEIKTARFCIEHALKWRSALEKEVESLPSATPRKRKAKRIVDTKE